MDGSGEKNMKTLETTYHHYRQLFEDRSRLTWQEESRIRHPGLREYIKHLYSDFWKHVDTITRLYFRMLELLNKRMDIENSINRIWTYYVSSPTEPKKTPSSESNTQASEKSTHPEQDTTTNEVNKWYKTRVVRYRTASEFATELRLSILIAIQEASSTQPVLSLSPVFSLLEAKVHWFSKQVRDLEYSIEQLDMSRHILRVELSTPHDHTASECINLTVKKTKPKEKKPRKCTKTVVEAPS